MAYNAQDHEKLIQSQLDSLSDEEKLKRAFNPNFPDTSPIPLPDDSPCEVSQYTPGIGESPIN